MSRHLPTVFLFLILILFRIIGSYYSDVLPNFQPLAALFFCAALLPKPKFSFLMALIAWALSYPAPALIMNELSFLNAPEMLTVLLAFAVSFLIAHHIQPKNLLQGLGGVILSAILFHLITNTSAWLGMPLYPKTALGWWQSIWMGPSGSTIPSWVFLKNLCVANSLFILCFFIAKSSWSSSKNPLKSASHAA